MAKDIVMKQGEPDVESRLHKSLPAENGKGEQGPTLTHTKEDKCIAWLNANYDLQRNEVTWQIEDNGKELSEQAINSLYLDAKRQTQVSNQSFMLILNSNYVKGYNPLKEWFELRNDKNPEGLIEKLAATLNSDTGFLDKLFYPLYIETFLRKWMVGLVASVFGGGNHNVLMLVLTGRKNTGKTEWFRRLLPLELQIYFCHNKLDQKKDSAALMVTKLLILNDEMDDFTTKKDAKSFRSFISANSYTYRPVYARKNQDYPRLATVCGTCNDDSIITDPENNRRIIPILLKGECDYELYNSINKEDLLVEAYNLYRNGLDWNLSSKEIAMLDEVANRNFAVYSLEEELVQTYFKPLENTDQENRMTVADIKNYIEKETTHRVYPVTLGKALSRLGFRQVKVNGKRLWEVHIKGRIEQI